MKIIKINKINIQNKNETGFTNKRFMKDQHFQNIWKEDINKQIFYDI